MDIDEREAEVVIIVPLLELADKVLIAGPVAGDEGLGAVGVLVDGHLLLILGSF